MIAHGNIKADSKDTSLNKWKALTTDSSVTKQKAIQNWQIGEVLDIDIEPGVWILTEDQVDSDDEGEITAHAGCFMRLSQDQTDADEQSRVAQRAGGQTLLVSKKMLQQVEKKAKLSKTTDTDARLRSGENPKKNVTSKKETSKKSSTTNSRGSSEDSGSSNTSAGQDKG